MKDKWKRYQITCPYCGKVQYACKSFLHELEVEDAGHGTCLDCGGFMKIIYNQLADTMKAETWEIRRKENASKGRWCGERDLLQWGVDGGSTRSKAARDREGDGR